MEIVSGPAAEICKSVCDPVVKTIKALSNLSDDAERLETDIKSVRSIAQEIQNQLDGHGRNPVPVVKGWLEREDKLIKSAEQALRDYNEIKEQRCCYCCPFWWSLLSSSNSIRACLTKIERLLERKAAHFPQNGELGEIPTTLPLPLLEDSELVGNFVHENLKDVEDWLLNRGTVRVIGVSGMPGVGKSTILKKIYNNDKVKKSFDSVIWLTVPRKPNILEIQESMCPRLGVRLHPNSGVELRAAHLLRALEKGRTLLILDDMWTFIDVAELGVRGDLIRDSKVKILLSTRTKSVCDNMNADRIIAIKKLPDEDGWNLFRRGAFGNRDLSAMDSQVEILARNIAEECKGHPLALKVVAQTMPKREIKPEQLKFNLNQLKTVNLNFYRTHEVLIRDLFKPLKYSYDALPTPEDRKCFLYLAAFREDVEIDAQELIEIWRAEGLVKDYAQGRYGVLTTLDDRCLVEIETREERVKIHDVLRDMAVQIGENDENSIFRAGYSLESFPDCASTELRRVSVMHNQITSLPENFDCSELLSLFLSCNPSLVKVPERFLEKLSSLKVLDLSNTAIKSLPSSIGQLKRLVYLRISSTQIEALPHEVFLLTNLELLDLSFSSLTDLPAGISELKRLRILHLTKCKHLKSVSSRISELTLLEELDMWKASFAFSGEVNGPETENRMWSSREASLQDICSLHGLKRLQVSIKSPIEKDLIESLDGQLWGVGIHQADLLSDMWQLRKLERLHLHDCEMRSTPDLFSTYQNLKFLKLNCCRRLQTLGGLGLGKLPNLRKLKIEECEALKELGKEFGAKGNFPSLSVMTLRGLRSLESLFGDRVEAGGLTRLQTLRIFGCKNLKSLPSGLDRVNLDIS